MGHKEVRRQKIHAHGCVVQVGRLLQQEEERVPK